MLHAVTPPVDDHRFVEQQRQLLRHQLNGRGMHAAQPQLGFVDEGGGLQGVSLRFAGHLPRRHTAEFLVNDGEKFGGGFWITVFHPFQNMRELAQRFKMVKRRRQTSCERSLRSRETEVRSFGSNHCRFAVARRESTLDFRLWTLDSARGAVPYSWR